MNTALARVLIGLSACTPALLFAADVGSKVPAPTHTVPPAAAAKVAAKPAAPAEPALRPTTLTVAQILERNAMARGGADAWRKVTTLTLNGKMDAGRARVVHPEDYEAGHKRPLVVPGSEADRGTLVQVPFKMSFKRPRKARVEITYNGGQAVQVYDGVHGFKMRPYLNRTDWQPYSAEELRTAAAQQELDGPLLDSSRKGTKIEVLGVAPVEGRDSIKLRLSFKDGQQEFLWLDAATYLDSRIDSVSKVNGRDRTVSTSLKDYRNVNGVQIPFLTVTQVAGRPDPERIIVETAAINTPLDDAAFAPQRPVDGAPAVAASP